MSLFSEGHSGNARGAPAISFDVYDHPTDYTRFSGNLKFLGKGRAEAAQDDVAVRSENAISGTAHADVRDVGRSSMQDSLVGGGDVGVGADGGRESSGRVPTHRDFLAGGFRMEVEQPVRGRDQLVEFVDGAEGVVVPGLHGDAAADVHHGELNAVARDDRPPSAGRALGEIDGSDDRAIFVEVAVAFSFGKAMVTKGDGVDFRGEELVGDFGRDSVSARRVFAVNNRKEGLVGVLEGGESFQDYFPPRFAHDVAEEQDSVAHALSLTEQIEENHADSSRPSGFVVSGTIVDVDSEVLAGTESLVGEGFGRILRIFDGLIPFGGADI
jgi:hypothetical protein